ncbi:class I SAM-dependent methyltransferase [uncultured Roseobacter sp.]|uniref:class I SAM-dependent methyltransferase n=1 Tax=uncultured Roseobacter sp. TaxID=114847 RepID=UPI00262B586D|nr:class I SAM-dependent methyltransferase [uncultured Roseobacter sp.]
MSSDNSDQREFWSDAAGPKWVQMQAQMDQLMQPVLDGVWIRAGLTQGQRVLDVGSGTGASTLQAADQVAPDGHVTGADISDTMTTLARKRAGGRPDVSLILADVAHHPFQPDSFDAVVSRFGVMFFADAAGAFANIRAAMVPGARITFAAWAAIPDNPFFTTPAQVAKSLVGAPPRPDPDAPGPFAFRDAGRVTDILNAAGFTDICIDTAHTALDGGSDPAGLAQTMCRIGPAEAALRYAQAGADMQKAVEQALSKAVGIFSTPDGLRIPASVHYVTALA